MARDVDHIIGAAQNKEVTIGIADAPVEGAVNKLAWYAFPVGIDKTFIITPHGLHSARGQWAFDDNHAF